MGYSVGLFIANPPVASAILAGAGIGTLFSKKLGPKISGLFKKIKKKVRDWWLGPEVVPEQPKMTAEEVNEKIEELQMEKYVLEEEIRILTDEINLLADDNPAKQAKAQQVQEKQARLHSIELEVTALLEKFDIEHIMGGPSK